jgi:hypothetical protein
MNGLGMKRVGQQDDGPSYAERDRLTKAGDTANLRVSAERTLRVIMPFTPGEYLACGSESRDAREPDRNPCTTRADTENEDDSERRDPRKP